MVYEDARCDAERLACAIASGPILPNVTPQEIRDHLRRYDFSGPLALDDVAADVERMLRAWNVQITHPRYLGLFNPSVTPASVLAETLAAMHNPQLASWRTSPAANEIERHTLSWLAAKFGLPSHALASFTSGGSEANLSAVVVALTKAFPEYGEQGVRRLPASPAIYLTSEAHHGFLKIAHMTGIGRRAIRTVATDHQFKMDLGDLSRRVSEDRNQGLAPFMVVGTAGTTGTGAIDPLAGLAEFCRSEDLWFHVDAAWGGAAAVSPRLRGFLAGIEAADSITCDAHKWFSVPMGAGMFFCRHADAAAEAFRVETSFMPRKGDGSTIDPYTTSVQWSRRFIGLKLFLALAHLGESGYAAMIEHQAHMGEVLRESLQSSGWSILNATPLPLVCFAREALDVPSFLAALHERQIAWMSPVRLGDGPLVLRACITSFRTTQTDIKWVVKEMNRLTS
jgi:aromatic-L-amino-acid decarboxylase